MAGPKQRLTQMCSVTKSFCADEGLVKLGSCCAAVHDWRRRTEARKVKQRLPSACLHSPYDGRLEHSNMAIHTHQTFSKTKYHTIKNDVVL